jgi:chaperonin GroES
MSIRPLHDRVLVRREDEETKTPGGIVLPGSAQEKPMKGKVIAAGRGKILDDGSVRALDVKINDRILFGKYSGTEVKVEGKELLMMREEDILAVVE